MPAPTPIVFTVTDAGRLAALNAQNSGLQIKLETLRGSTGKITPTGAETALTGTLRGSWAIGGGGVNEASSTLRFFALVQSATSISDVFSLGLFTDDDVLFAIASTTGSNPLIVCHANIDFLPSFGMRLPDVAASAITIETDPNSPLAQVLMTQHQAAENPHPQYLRLGDYTSLRALFLEFLGQAYPVGSVYFNKSDSRNPAEILGFGTWSRESGRFIVGQSLTDATFETLGSTGGEKQSLINLDQLPDHQHHRNEGQDEEQVLAAGGTKGNVSGGSSGDLITDKSGGVIGLPTTQVPFSRLPPYVVYAVWVRTA